MDVELREDIKPKDSIAHLIMLMSEGNMGATTVIMQMFEKLGDDAVEMMLHLDDMNIRGTQIWIGYKDCCGQNIDKFIKCVKERDIKMIEKINEEGHMGNHVHKAVKSGGSYKGRQFLIPNK